jgi:hypothetical protein
MPFNGANVSREWILFREALYHVVHGAGHVENIVVP